jgi:hypothetical protein
MKDQSVNKSQSGDDAPVNGLRERLLLTRKEAAVALGLKEGTLRTWASIGRGPRYKKLSSGTRAGVRYPIEEIRAYAEDPAAYERGRRGL